MAWMRKNAIALNQAKEPIRMNGCGRRASDSLQSTISGVAYAARITRRVMRHSVRRQGRREVTARSVPHHHSDPWQN